MELICTTYPWSCGPILWGAAVLAVVGLVTGLVAGFSRMFGWLLAPLAWIRSKMELKRERLQVSREHERTVQENTALKDRNALLERRVQELENRVHERESWERFTTKGGGVVLIEKGHADPTAAGVVFACVYCFEDRKVFPLQRVGKGRFLQCPTHGNFNYESDGTMKINPEAVERAGPPLGPQGWMAR